MSPSVAVKGRPTLYSKETGDEIWLSPARPVRAETRLRRSRFVADLTLAENLLDATAHLERVRAEFPHASHHCWAFRIHTPGKGLVERCSDAAEPPGSAGVPILRALQTAAVEGVSLVVARWFGGTKLGIGPLARAYRDTTMAALEASGVQYRQQHRLFRIRFPYSFSGEVRRALASLKGIIQEERPGPRADLLVGVPQKSAESLASVVASASRGQAEVQEVGIVVLEVAK